MKIDFNNISEETLTNFKGGNGLLITRNYIDNQNKIMMSSLRPGASSGYHLHDGNNEIVYIIKGKARFIYDGKEEFFNAGDVHYCPDGHSHSMHNDTDEDLSYLAIVI